MPTNKHAIIRYHVLDRCFSDVYKHYFVEDLIEACNKALYEYDGSKGISRRQIFDDINFMEDPEGYHVKLKRIKEGKRTYYRYENTDYSIDDKPLSEKEIVQLEQTIAMLERFKGLAGFGWMDELLMQLRYRFSVRGEDKSVIGFEQNDQLVGLKYLTPLFNAIINKQVVHIDYKDYREKVHSWEIHPYYLKQYNNRWFLLGLNDKRKTITNVALDRIESISLSSIKYIRNYDIDFERYFNDIVGVTIPEDEGSKVETVELKFSPKRFPYVKSKPLHRSQLTINEEERIVAIEVRPNWELETLLLSFGPDVEVLAPALLREKIAQKALGLSDIYQK